MSDRPFYIYIYIHSKYSVFICICVSDLNKSSKVLRSFIMFAKFYYGGGVNAKFRYGLIG